MQMSDINPFVRFAQNIFYKAYDNPVYVQDCRMFYILSGTGDIFIKNQHYKLLPNTVFYCSAGNEYNIVSEEGISLIALNFDLTQANSKAKECLSPASVLNKPMTNRTVPTNVKDSAFLHRHIYIPNGEEMYHLINNIQTEFSQQKIFFREKCSGMLKTVLMDLHRIDPAKSKNAAEAVDFLISYIGDNFTESLSNNELAALTGYHEYHLNRLFIRLTGTSMHKYILRLRISEAKRLIANTDMPLNRIAEKSGFASDTYFSAYFKKETNLSPSQYRNKFKNMI